MAAFGQVLRQERELRGIELREVADATKISMRFLQALEDDRLEVLPGGIFPRAFVRQYAEYLGLDADRIVNDFLYAHGNAASPPAAPVRPVAVSAKAAPRPERGRGPVVLAAVAVTAVLVASGWAALRWAGSAEGPPQPAVPPPSSFPPDDVYPPPTSGTTLPTASEALVIGLTARQECWVSVQADGVRVLDRVLAAGETETVRAKDELVLSVGNAGGLSFTVNGRSGIPLGGEGEVRRNVVITRESLASLLQGPPPRDAG